jgi:hypothetical protein
MRAWSTTILFALAFSLGASAAHEEPLDVLIARAQSAHPGDQPALYIEIAERELKAADQLYSDGHVEDGQARVKDLVTYSDRAHDAAASSGKRLKNTEIALRKMAARLRDMKHSLSVEDQAPLQSAADHLENLRVKLLSHLFAK